MVDDRQIDREIGRQLGRYIDRLDRYTDRNNSASIYAYIQICNEKALKDTLFK